MTPLRTLIVGCGGFAQANVPGIRQHGGFQIVALADPDEATRRRFGERVQVDPAHQFASAEEALAQVQVDFCFVFSSVLAHAANCRAALQAGCPVSVAKPFVNTLEEGVELVALARQRGLWISVGQTSRISLGGQALKEFIARGEIGRPAFGTIHHYRDRMFGVRDYSLHEPWPVINATAIHEFDFYRYLFDTDIARVAFRGIDVEWNPYDDPGVITGWFEMANGFVTTFFQSFVSRLCRDPGRHPYNHSMIQGSRGALFTRGTWTWGETLLHRYEAQTVEPVTFPTEPFEANTLRYCQWLWEAVHGRRPNPIDAADNLWSLAAIKAAQHSAQHGGPIVDVRAFARAAGLSETTGRP